MTSPTVLVVDDAPDLRFLIRLGMEAAGLRVTEAVDGVSAIAEIQSNPPDLMLLDLRMPVLDGVGVLDWMRDNDLLGTFPVIVLSAWADRETAEAIRARGCAWAGKPFDMVAIVQQVKELLAQ